MSSAMGVLLTVGILAMVGCVIWLSVVNRRRLARQQAAAATAVHLAPTSRAAAVGNIDLVWRRTDQRRAFALLEGIHRGWQTKAFLFRHDQDLVERGGRTLVGLFARRFLSVFDLVFDARTAQQRGVLVAVDYSGAPARFKLRGRRLVARDVSAREVLGSRSLRLGTWAPPARVRVDQGWVFLQSFYVVPRWIERFVPVSVEICERLESAGVTRREANDFTAMPGF